MSLNIRLKIKIIESSFNPHTMYKENIKIASHTKPSFSFAPRKQSVSEHRVKVPIHEWIDNMIQEYQSSHINTHC